MQADVEVHAGSLTNTQHTDGCKRINMTDTTYQISYGGTKCFDIESKYRELHHLLETYDCEVIFTKVDGTVRAMPCTLRADQLPPKPLTENTEPRKINHNVISAWCLDKQSWRSFRTENVICIKVLK